MKKYLSLEVTLIEKNPEYIVIDNETSKYLSTLNMALSFDNLQVLFVNNYT